MRRLGLALLVLAAASCGSSVNTTPGGAVPTLVRVASKPPSAKDVIEAAMASANVPLKSSANCANAGTEPSDGTIGRYLAGFMAELSSPERKNWIETKIEPGRSAAGEPVSICTLMLRHEHGDDRWGWGVQFHVRSSDGLVLSDSFACIGAG
jgi:hypothetical protein